MKNALNETESKTLWEKIIKDVENLPPFPGIVTKILADIDDPRSSHKDFQNIILNDPALTMKILKMANSAYYGYSRQIDTLSQALIILGLITLKSIVIAASAYSTLAKKNISYGLSHGDLYAHSIATAIGSKLISKYKGVKKNEMVFIAGVLNDI